MAKLTKRAKAIRGKIDANKQYPIDEALALLKDLSAVKFTEFVALAVHLVIALQKSDEVVRRC